MIPVPEPSEITTIRYLIDGLLELAGMLPEGTDTPVELGICDGKDLQLIDQCDLGHWAKIPADGSGPPSGYFVLIRGHVHPGEKAGELMRGAASDADQELRDLTGDS
jgi:hypothetical protein